MRRLNSKLAALRSRSQSTTVPARLSHCSGRGTPSRGKPLTARLMRPLPRGVRGDSSRTVELISPHSLHSRMDTRLRQRAFAPSTTPSAGASRRALDSRAAIASLLPQDQAAILDRVRTFDDFTPENDPHGEHDFGSFEHKGRTIFWKIDYYDLFLNNGSSDPSDPALTRRVLTVMLRGRILAPRAAASRERAGGREASSRPPPRDPCGSRLSHASYEEARRR